MKYILLAGQPNTGKTTVIRWIYDYLIGIGYTSIVYNYPFDSNNDVRDPLANKTHDFRAILLRGSSIILINSGSDTIGIIEDFEEFCKRKCSEYKIDILISSVRDIGQERNRLFSSLGIAEGESEDLHKVLEIPLGKVTRRNNKNDILEWYSNSLGKLIKHVLHQKPFGI